MAGNAQGEGCLPDARPGSDDDQLRVLQAGRLLIEVGEAGRQAADRHVAALGAGVDAVVCLLQCLLQGVRLAGDAHLGDVQDLAFGRFQQLVGRLGLVVGVAEDLSAGVDQVADDCLVADDAGVVLGVGSGRGGVPELGQVGVAADVLDLLLFAQVLGQGNQIDRVAAVIQGHDGLVNFDVMVEVEILGAEDLDDVADDAVVAQHASHHAALGFSTLRG